MQSETWKRKKRLVEKLQNSNKVLNLGNHNVSMLIFKCVKCTTVMEYVKRRGSW